jgi:flagellar hook-length control protein FliK
MKSPRIVLGNAHLKTIRDQSNNGIALAFSLVNSRQPVIKDMENMAILNFVAQQSANATLALADPFAGVAGPDLSASASGKGIFGALLARQIAFGASQEDQSQQTGLSVDEKIAVDLSVAALPDSGVLPGVVASYVLPFPIALHQNVVKSSTEEESVASPIPTVLGVGAEPMATPLLNVNSPGGGKDLPVTDAIRTNIAVTSQTQERPEVTVRSSEGGVSPALSFDALIGEKKAATSLDAPVITTAPMASSQFQPDVIRHDKMQGGVPQELSVPQRVGSENWGQGLGDKVVWIVGNQTRGAEIHLNPPALGPLEVRISVTDGSANLSFMTQHASVRDAIEAATPRLREMLGDTGISMGSVSVNVGTFAQQQTSSDNRPNGSGATWHPEIVAGEPLVDAVVTTVRPLPGRGMIDLFA